MGVKGLWKLLDGTGRPVNTESLEGLILAVDISIWLNMAIKGARDYHGNAANSGHLMTLFNRICKLLYYGVKPVFVFDGQTPLLKQRTVRERIERNKTLIKESKKGSEKILQNYLKKQILEEVVGSSKKSNTADTPPQEDNTLTESSKKVEVSKNKHEKDIYELPALSSQLEDSNGEDSEKDWEMRSDLVNEYYDDYGGIDVSSVLSMNTDSTDFKSLPSDLQYELLKELKEIRKRRRTRLEAMPEESNSFSSYQIAGLLSKRKISKKMESVEKKMAEENIAASTVHAGILGYSQENYEIKASQLASDSSSHYIWMRTPVGTAKSTESVKAADENIDIVKEGKPPTLDENSLEKNLLPPIYETAEHSEDIKAGAGIVSSTHIVQKVKGNGGNTPSHAGPGDGKTAENASGPAEGPAHVESVHVHVDQKLDSTSQPKAKPDVLVDAEPVHIVEETDFSADRTNLTSGTELEKVPATEHTDIRHDTSYRPDIATDNQVGDGAAGRFEPVHEEKKRMEVMKEISTTKSNVIVSMEDTPKQTYNVQSAETGNVISEKISDAEDSTDDEFIEIAPGPSAEAPDVIEPTDKDDEHNIIVSDQSENQITLEKEPPCPAETWADLDINNVDEFNQQLDAESAELKKMVQAKERASRDVSHSLRLECQELLQLFGLPFIISPQEAEAQCATLELLGLTNGTITEDSDVWLFGGRYVIKNMFSSNNDPVSFSFSDIEMKLGLNRDRFICIALCSGSDYTTGIDGVGPVTAMEILKEFQGDGIDGLKDMKKWWQDVTSNANVTIPTETKIKNQLRRVSLKKDFPSKLVYDAYANPIVNEAKTEFEWGFPDLDELRTFAVGVMGWTRHKANETLLPVVKKMGERRTKQAKITHYLPVARQQHATKKKSKRVMNAAAALTGNQSNIPPKRARGRTTKRVSKNKVKPAKEDPKLSESSSDD